MITAIDYIKLMGKFDDFRWCKDTPPFTKTNLIFGYNGSGKSTISNVLRLYSTQSHDEKDIIFSDLSSGRLNSEVGIRILGSNKPLSVNDGPLKENIYVFNSDFIEDHVYSGSVLNCKAFDPLVVTEGQLKNPRISALEQQIIRLSEEKITYQKTRQQLEEVFDAIKKALSAEFNSKVSGSRTPSLNIPSLIPEGTVQDVTNNLANAYQKYEFSQKQEELNADISELRGIDFQRLKIDMNAVVEVLHRSVSSNAREKVQNKIDLLSNSQISATEITKWLFTGYGFLQKAKGQSDVSCPLCNSDLNLAIDILLSDYQNYFNDEFEKLVSSIDQFIVSIDADLMALSILETEFGRLSRLEAKYKDLFLLDNFSDAIFDSTAIRSALAWLRQCLIEKRGKIDRVDWSYDANVASHFDKCNAELDGYNARSVNLRSKLEGSFIDPGEMLRQIKKLIEQSAGVQFNIDGEGGRIEVYKQAGQKVVELGQEIANLETQRASEVANLKDESRYVNHYLKKLGIHHFDILIKSDDSGESVRVHYSSGVSKTKLRHSLSESEKTALAFAYFISKVCYEVIENSKAKLEDTIVILDDPVSSLDENRLHDTACLIFETFETAKQTFIFSHNLTFMKFLSNIIGNQRIETAEGKKESCRNDYYLCAHQKTLLALPEQLRGYRTTYFQRLDDLAQFNNGKISYEEAKRFLPNHVRSVLESFLSFKFYVLHQGSSNEKYLSPGLDRLINVLKSKKGLFKAYSKVGNIDSDSVIATLQRIKYVTDPQSHGGPNEVDAVHFISEPELKDVVSKALEIIAFLDGIHFNEVLG